MPDFYLKPLIKVFEDERENTFTRVVNETSVTEPVQMTELPEPMPESPSKTVSTETDEPVDNDKSIDESTVVDDTGSSHSGGVEIVPLEEVGKKPSRKKRIMSMFSRKKRNSTSVQ